MSTSIIVVYLQCSLSLLSLSLTHTHTHTLTLTHTHKTHTNTYTLSIALSLSLSFSLSRYLANASDVYISYLPMAHSMEIVLQMTIITCGASVGFYSGDVRKLVTGVCWEGRGQTCDWCVWGRRAGSGGGGNCRVVFFYNFFFRQFFCFHIFFSQHTRTHVRTEDLPALQPTIMAGVPRVYSRIYDKVMQGLEEKGSFVQWMYGVAYSNQSWCKSNVRRMNESCHTWMSHVTHEWVIS